MYGRWRIFEGWIELFINVGIVETMRRIVLLMMIFLLPLRGWAGAVMSVEMSTQSLASASFVASNLQSQRAGDGAAAEIIVRSYSDCLDHSVMQPAGEAFADSSKHCNTCVACQICHTVALTGVTPLQLAPVSAGSPIATGSTRFASAALRTGFKPPIS